MSREYWEAHYQSGDTHWDKGTPSPGLVDFLAAHPDLLRGTVVIHGCGTGHDVREFARAGFDAQGFDIAPSAIRLAREKTKAAGLKAKFHLVDFLRDDPPQFLIGFLSTRSSAPSNPRNVTITSAPCCAGSSRADNTSRLIT